MPRRLIHATDHKEFWSGRIHGVCGDSAEHGEYTTTWFASTTCEACLRILRDRKRGGRRR